MNTLNMLLQILQLVLQIFDIYRLTIPHIQYELNNSDSEKKLSNAEKEKYSCYFKTEF